MTPLRRIAVIGNSLPRRCGIATFTTDLQQAISTSRPTLETCIVAMTDHGQTHDYPKAVAFQIQDNKIEEYIRAADFLNAGRFDTVCLQHEFGIFGGEAGGHVLELLSRLTMPVVTTFHTVLANPTAPQRAPSAPHEPFELRAARIAVTDARWRLHVCPHVWRGDTCPSRP